jgi:integrase
MQEIRRFKPSTVSRRFSVAAGFYRTCVIDGVLEHSPAEHVRRPAVPAESPTLGFTHLQFEALLTAAPPVPSRYDFALVAMLGLPGMRIFEATGANIADLGEEHGHRVLRLCGKIVLVPLPPAVGRAIDRANGDRVCGPILLNSRGTPDRPPRGHPPPAPPSPSCRGTHHQAAPPHAQAHIRHHHARCRDGSAGCLGRSPPRRSTHHDPPGTCDLKLQKTGRRLNDVNVRLL